MRMFQAPIPNRVSRVRFTPDVRTLSLAVRQSVGVVHIDTTTGTTQRWRPEPAWMPADLVYSTCGGFVGVGMNRAVTTYRRSREGSSQSGEDISPELMTGFLVETSNLHRSFPVAINFSPTTHSWATRLGIACHELTVWNPHTQEYIVAPEEGDYRGISFGPDGTTVTSIEYHAHALCVWQVKPFQVLFRTDLRGIDTFDNGSVAMLPDGERVILAAGNHLRCVSLSGAGGWDTTAKKPPLEIALHPTGGTLLVADGSKKVTAYDTTNGRPAAQYDWGIGKIGCVTYSPDGTLAAAGGEKGQVVVWDAE